MDSIFIGRGLVPLFDISRPLLKCPPWSTIFSEIDLNQAPQACMISGVGFTNPKCRYTNFFTSLSLLMGSPISFSYVVRFRRRRQTGRPTRNPPDIAADHPSHRA